MKMLNGAYIATLMIALTGVCGAGEPSAEKSDMSQFKAVVEEALKLLKSSDYPGALKKTSELEDKWDEGTKGLKSTDRKLWNTIDKQMDAAIEACKIAKDASSGDKATAALNEFLKKLSLVEKPK